MPILYDQYQLSNSTQIPKFQGSAIPELTQVMNATQEKYDYGVQQADALDYLLKSSSAANIDRPEFQKLKQEYRSKLEGFAKKGDYENMWRDVAMAARDFTGKYKSFAENHAAISKYMNEEADRMGKGEVSKADYEANVRRIQDSYTGLQFNPQTGQYENKFSANPLVKAPDMIEKINKILTNTHPKVRGYSFKGMTADNMFEYSNGSNTQVLPWSEVAQYVQAGLSIDPDVQSYFAQQKELAPYMYGFSNRLSDAQALKHIQSTQDAAGLDMINKGLSPKEALYRSFQSKRMQELESGIFGLARKGVVDERTSSSSQTLSGFGSAELSRKTAKKENTFAVTMVSPGGGATVNGAADFDAKFTEAADSHYNAKVEYTSWLTNKTKHSDGRVTMTENGVEKDVTAQANEFRDRIRAAETEKKNYEAVKVAAERESGFSMTAIPESVKTLAQKAYDEAYKEKVSTGSYDSMDNTVTPLSESQRKKNAEFAYQSVIKDRTKNPLYAKYEEALKRRMNNEAESESMILIGNKQTKDLWSENLTSLISGIGKDSPLALTYAGGTNKGQQLEMSDYKDIEGKVDVVGFQKNDQGQTVMVLRAMEDIKGKKTKGENLLVSLGNTNVDDWLSQNMPTDKFEQFTGVGMVKKALANPTRRAQFSLTNDTENGPKATVYKDGNRWTIEYPGADGKVSVNFADGSDGILNQIQEAAQTYAPKQ